MKRIPMAIAALILALVLAVPVGSQTDGAPPAILEQPENIDLPLGTELQLAPSADATALSYSLWMSPPGHPLVWAHIYPAGGGFRPLSDIETFALPGAFDGWLYRYVVRGPGGDSITEPAMIEVRPRETTTTTTTEAPPAGGAMLLTPAELAALPTSGPHWQEIVDTAQQSFTVDLVDQDDKTPVHVLAGAIVTARTGDTAMRAKVVAALEDFTTATTNGGRTLSLGRQYSGFVLAADLIGYREPAFVDRAAALMYEDIGGHGRWPAMNITASNTSNNWGTFNLGSFITGAIYTNNGPALDQAAMWLRSYGEDTGHRWQDTSSHDHRWHCDEGPLAINPVECGETRGGILVEDASRQDSGPPTLEGSGLSYSIEGMQGLALGTELLTRQGYDAWTWGTEAVCRAAVRIGDDWADETGVGAHVPFLINARCGTNLPTVATGGVGRGFGFTGWLYSD